MRPLSGEYVQVDVHSCFLVFTTHSTIFLDKKELSTLVPDELLDDEAIETTMEPKTKFEDEDEIETTMMPMIDDDMVSTYYIHTTQYTDQTKRL